MRTVTTSMPAPAKSYITPWTLQAYDALPGTPVWIGTGFAVALSLVFFVGRAVTDGAADSTPRDLRLAIVHILFVAYAASAYAYLLTAARKSVHDLAPVARHAPLWQAITSRVAKHPWWALVLVGVALNLASIPTVIETTTEGSNPWDWQHLNYDVRWHRVLSVFVNWWIGCFAYVLVVESLRLSRLSDSMESLDILDLRPYQPLIRQGLTNALLVIGMASVASLFLLETGFGAMLMRIWAGSVMFAWIGLMLPLRGIRKGIRVAKDQELEWCLQALKTARNELKSGADGQQSIAEIVAYRTLIESIRSWPFDNPTLVRFALYLLIPLGSWLGGAMVERGLDVLLS